MSVQTILDIFHREDEKIEVGDIVTTTTSEFDYNGLTASFDKEATVKTTVIAEHIEDDYSEYDPDKCETGGKYGYSFYEVIDTKESLERRLFNLKQQRNRFYQFGHRPMTKESPYDYKIKNCEDILERFFEL